MKTCVSGEALLTMGVPSENPAAKNIQFDIFERIVKEYDFFILSSILFVNTDNSEFHL